jgi:hypothetical protein
VTYAWSARDRLCPPRMVWLERHHYHPEFEIARMRMRSLRAYNRVERPAESRVEADRWNRRRFAGRLGEWPLYKPYGRRKEGLGYSRLWHGNGTFSAALMTTYVLRFVCKVFAPDDGGGPSNELRPTSWPA